MTDTKTPNPMVLAAKKKVEDKAKRRGRAYGIGQRDPEKADVSPEDFASSARWRKLRKLVQAGRLTGSKY